MTSRLPFLFALLLCALGPVTAAEPTTPKPGSQQRKAIMDALRVPVQGELKQPVIFQVSRLRVLDGWAFLAGAPLKPDGSEINYRGTKYQELIDEGAFDGGIFALLRQRNGQWTVTRYIIGATDIPYVDWPADLQAPPSLFEP